MAPTHKVAVIQLYPKPLAQSLNFQKAASFVRAAAAQGAKLAVLPEYHLTNWLPHEPKFLECCDEWKVYLNKYKDLAKECKICIVPGTIVERHKEIPDEDERGTLLNVAYFIDDKGEIVGKYVKKNLWYAFLQLIIPSPHPIFSQPSMSGSTMVC